MPTLRSGRSFPTPFRVPRFSGAMIFGTLDGAATDARFAGEGFAPARGGPHALGCLWLSDFAESTVGPYRELTLTVLVSRARLELPWINAYTPIAAQLRPDVVVCEYVLLLDNQDAIDYGRELHGFDKQPGALAIDARDGGFEYRVEQQGAAVVHGRLARRGVVGLPAALAGVARAHGVVATARLLATRVHRIPVVTPRAVRQLRSDLYFRGRASLFPWGAGDQLVVGDAPVGRLLRELAFTPTAVQRITAGEGWMPAALENDPERLSGTPPRAWRAPARPPGPGAS